MKKKLNGIYVIVFETGIKFGMSEDINNRYCSYLSPWCQPIKEAYCIECQNPKYVESLIKQKFSENITARSYEFIVGVDIKNVLNFLMANRLRIPIQGLFKRHYKNCKLLRFYEGKFLSEKEIERIKNWKPKDPPIGDIMMIEYEERKKDALREFRKRKRLERKKKEHEEFLRLKRQEDDWNNVS